MPPNFQALLENSDDALLLIDTQGKILYETPSLFQITGVQPSERIGRSVFEFIHTDDLTIIRALFDKLITGGPGWQSSELRIKHKDGTLRWIEAKGVNALQNPDIGAIVVNLRDITKRKKIEEELKTSYRLIQSIYMNVYDVLFLLGVEPGDQFRFLSVNPAFYTATGLHEDQVKGKLVQEVIPEPSLSLVLKNYQEAITGRKQVTWVETTTYPTGIKYGEVSVEPIFDANGVCTNLVGSVHDVTALKKATG